MKTKSTPLDTFVGDRVTTAMLVRPRAGDFGQLRNLVTGDHPNRAEMIADLRQRTVKALKEINAATPEGNYAAFMLGANMNHIFGKDYSGFEDKVGPSFGIGGAYFYQGYLGIPFRKIVKPDLIYGKIINKPVNVIKKARKSSPLLKPTSRPTKADALGSAVEQAQKIGLRGFRNETSGFDQHRSTSAHIPLTIK